MDCIPFPSARIVRKDYPSLVSCRREFSGSRRQAGLGYFDPAIKDTEPIFRPLVRGNPERKQKGTGPVTANLSLPLEPLTPPNNGPFYKKLRSKPESTLFHKCTKVWEIENGGGRGDPPTILRGNSEKMFRTSRPRPDPLYCWLASSSIPSEFSKSRGKMTFFWSGDYSKPDGSPRVASRHDSLLSLAN